MSMERLNADFARIFDDHKHDCEIQEAVESGKRPDAAANRFAALDTSIPATRIAETEGEDHV